MKDRMKELRHELHLTQQEFADKIGIKRNAIAGCEAGRTEPSGALVALICHKFNVSEEWLKTGKGEMFVQRTRNEEIAAYMGRLLNGKCSDVESAIISVMAKTSIDEWKMIEKKALELLGAMDEKEPDQD